MNLGILRSTTAIVLAAGLLQPSPLLAQADAAPDAVLIDGTTTGEPPTAGSAPLTPEEICAEAGITDPLACADYIVERETDAMEAAAAQEALEADAQAEAEAEAQAEVEAEAEAAALQADQAAADAADAAAARAADDATSPPCLAEVVGADGTITCVDTLTPDTLDALAVGEAPGDAAEVTLETITEDSVRASAEDFEDSRGTTDAGSATAADGGSEPSDLERAGLFVLGAVVVGAILANGQRVEANTGDRIIVVDQDGTYDVLRDDDALLRQAGSELRTERFADGSTRTFVTREDGTQIITIRDSSGRALRRLRIDPDGQEYLLFDDTRVSAPVVLEDLPPPTLSGYDDRTAADSEALRLALLSADRVDPGRNFSLWQVRDIRQVRALAPEITLSGITFETNSAAIAQSQAEALRDMGQLMRALIVSDPTEIFLIEGYTDAVGAEGYNLLLSDRRAESVALAFSEYFDVPSENMVVQGYGESDLRIATQAPERANRRVAVRRITPLLRVY